MFTTQPELAQWTESAPLCLFRCVMWMVIWAELLHINQCPLLRTTVLQTASLSARGGTPPITLVPVSTLTCRILQIKGDLDVCVSTHILGGLRICCTYACLFKKETQAHKKTQTASWMGRTSIQINSSFRHSFKRDTTEREKDNRCRERKHIEVFGVNTFLYQPLASLPFQTQLDLWMESCDP